MKNRPPNILYLHCHDAGRYIQPYGHAIPTPSLQRLAEQGVLFRQAFTNNPTCSPSRACLLTGRYAHCNGMLGLAHRGFRLNDYSQHVIHTLHDAGYTSALSGTQHLANDKGGEPVASIGYHRILTHDSHTTAPTDAAIDFLHETHDRPFFLSVGYFAPHRGGVLHRPPQSFPALGPPADERYVLPPAPLPDTPETRRDIAEFSASMHSTDLQMGRVLDALDRAGLADNTLVIATTDHGIAFPGMKCRLTDHGLGVMLVVRGPAAGPFRGGKVVDAMVSHTDLFPTICDVADIAKPDWLQGKSILTLVTGEADRLHEAIFAEVNYHAAYEPMRAVRTERWKYIRRYDGRDAVVLPNCDDSLSKRLWYGNDWQRRSQPEEMLFDLVFDPHETGNLAGDDDYRQALQDMRSRLEHWMRDTDDPLLNGPIALPENAVTTDPDAYSPNGAPAP